MKKQLFFALACCVFASACSDSVVSDNGEAENCNVSLNLSIQDWGNTEMTRAGSELATPITVFYVAEGQTSVKQVATITSGDAKFSFSVPNGNYDIYAACGLAKDLIPNNINDVVKIPNNLDFSVASASFSVNNGSCDPIDLVANHEMAWLDMTITDVATSIKEMNIYVKGLYAEYVFNDGWQEATAAMKEKYTQVAVEKKDADYKAEGFISPCSDDSEVEFIAEVTTESGYTKLLKGTVNKSLSAGTHMIISTSLSSLNVIEEGITMSEWTETSASGTITDFDGLNLGDLYFGQAATVVKIYENNIYIFPHKPMTVSLSEVRSWTNYKDITYNESPEIKVNRWSLLNPTAAGGIANHIRIDIGWDKFVATFAATGNSFDQNSEKLIIGYSETYNVFYRLDGSTCTSVQVTDESGEFLLYPIGVISLLP